MKLADKMFSFWAVLATAAFIIYVITKEMQWLVTMWGSFTIANIYLAKGV